MTKNNNSEFLADPWARTKTRNGLAAADEVISALQKSI